MITVASTELKNKLGQVLDQARREPVLVQNHGRDVVVILDHAEYARLGTIEAADQVAPKTPHRDGALFLRSLAGLFDLGFASEQARALVDQALQQKYG